MKERTIADWEKLYPSKLEAMRLSLVAGAESTFTNTKVQKLHKIGYNHAMAIIQYGLDSGKIVEVGAAGKYRFT